jgi:23S rRNA (guanosine2251-2'-O)-methyltransferase
VSPDSHRPEPRRFRARQCVGEGGCGLRFPVDDGSPLGASCPHCGRPTSFVDEAYPSHEAPRGADVPRHAARLGALLDNIRSLRNVGSMFRTADGVGLELVVLGGVTPTPAHPGFAKTALGAESSVPWRGDADALRAAAQCVQDGWELWALEGGPRARSLFAADVLDAARGRAIMLVVGHEVSGVDPRILELCREVLYLPMVGRKGSLNVSVAFGVAAYALACRVA